MKTITLLAHDDVVDVPDAVDEPWWAVLSTPGSATAVENTVNDRSIYQFRAIKQRGSGMGMLNEKSGDVERFQFGMGW